jgi:membrane-associated phospholipid phosphatase
MPCMLAHWLQQPVSFGRLNAPLPGPAGAVLVLTRVFLLAHWASDVVAGLALGATLERLIRVGTDYGLKPGD